MVIYLIGGLILHRKDYFKREVINSHFFTLAIFLVTMDSANKYSVLVMAFAVTIYNFYILLKKRG